MLGRLFPGGRQLSGGQWQRLALGRLYFRPASVQIFDEPTAALDAIAEAAMIDRLREHGQRSHHAADFAPVLDGPHGRDDHRASRGHGRRGRAPTQDLLAKGGIYATLFNLQARGYPGRKLS